MKKSIFLIMIIFTLIFTSCVSTSRPQPHKHDFTYTLISFTSCNEEWEEFGFCNTCGYNYIFKSKGHDFHVIEKTDPTCFVEGKITWECSNCGLIETETIAKRHNFVLEDSALSKMYGVNTKIGKCTYCGKIDGWH